MMGTKTSPIDITTDEVVSLLKRTSLPTIIVEGCDDMIVYRAIEEKLAHLGVSMLPVGGRGKVLDVFQRKSEIPNTVRVAFIADKDLWVSIGIPEEFAADQLIFTEGYSIENDIFLDGELWKILKGSEPQKFETELKEFVEWYALAINRTINGCSEPISLHPDHVLCPKQRLDLLKLKEGEEYPAALREKIINEYKKLVRGKSLISLLLRNVNYKGREPRHTDKALLESVAIRPGPLLQRITSAVEAAINPSQPKQAALQEV
jgi:hypothetical protein